MLVLVVGVHRSGTSLLTAGLKAIGCRTGEFKLLADDHNPKGYFEHPQARNLSEELLGSLGVSWDNWAFHAASYQVDRPELEDWYRKAGEFLVDLCGSGPMVALKDPRIASLLPFWNRAIERAGLDCRRIIIIRDPAEVAESQFRRAQKAPHHNKIIADRQSMSALWAVTMHSVLRSLPESDSLLITHRAFYEDPRRSLRACADYLGLTPEPAALDGFVSEFFDASLRRSIPSGGSSGAWAEMAGTFYALLAALGDEVSLSGELGHRIALAQTQLEQQIPMLAATRASLGCLTAAFHRDLGDLEDRMKALSQVIWAVNDLALPRTDIRTRPSMVTLEELAIKLEKDLSVGVLAARLAIQGKHYDSAERILLPLVERFPNHPLTNKMLLSLFEATGRQAEAERVSQKLGGLVP